MKNYLVVALTVLVAGCVVPGVGDGGGPSGGSSVGLSGLKAFESCQALSEYLAPKDRDTGGGSIPNGAMGGMPGSSGDGEVSADEAGEASPEPVSAPVAETVEEADIVKQEGNRLYVVTTKDLLTYDISDPETPQRIGKLTIEFFPREIYVRGTKVAVIGDGAASASGDPATIVLIADLANAATPLALRKHTLGGYYSDSRMVGNAVYLALQNWVGGASWMIEERLKAHNPCDRVYVPADLDPGEYESFLSWDIVGINFADPSEESETVTVIGSGDAKVYSTPGHFYLANYFFESESTGVYLFDLDPATAGILPRSNALVSGSIVNQFSMDETNGVFRIVSTRAAGWNTDESFLETQNYLTTFRAKDGSLTRLGQIDTIVPGESVTAARFIGSKAFVATSIVQSDPLVAIDVSNPTEPRILSELHLPGMTNYIQEWGNYLVAIGSNGGWLGGVVLNLFDVSDPNNPLLVEQEELEGAYGSEAQFEHRAFAFFEDLGILAIPVDTDTGSEMALYRISGDTGFTRLGAVNHDDLVPAGTTYEGYSPRMRRALEEGNGEFLYTISEAGLKVSQFGDLTKDLFGEMFPGFSAPDYWDCGCSGDVCMGCPELF